MRSQIIHQIFKTIGIQFGGNVQRENFKTKYFQNKQNTKSKEATTFRSRSNETNATDWEFETRKEILLLSIHETVDSP